MPHAIRVHQPGGPEVMQWEEVTVGDPGPGQARVRHTAVGLNYIDTYHRSGLYKLPMPTGLGKIDPGGVTVRKFSASASTAGLTPAWIQPPRPIACSASAMFWRMNAGSTSCP